MENGYRIFWTEHALGELQQTVDYLLEKWTEREVQAFSRELDNTIELISRNPEIFPISEEAKDIRKVVISRYNNLYYRIGNNAVEILSLFSNRQDPERKKLNS